MATIEALGPVSSDFGHRQGVGLDDPQATRRGLGESLEQACEPGVGLDGDDPGVRFQQGAGEAPGAWSDFEDALARFELGQPDDFAADVEVEQEVLAEAFVRLDAGRREGGAGGGQGVQVHAARRRAMSAASRIAAIRLSGRALPDPAIS